jgi:hypothetical protein
MLTAEELDLKHTLEFAETATLDDTVAEVEHDLEEQVLIALTKQLRTIPVRQAIRDGLKMTPTGARRFWAAYLLPRGTSDEVVIATLKGKKT